MLGQMRAPSLCSQALVQGGFLQQDNLRTDGCKTQENTLHSVAQLLKSGWARGQLQSLPREAHPQMEQDPQMGKQVQEAWARKPALWGLIRDGSGPAVPTSPVPVRPGAADFHGVWPAP